MRKLKPKTKTFAMAIDYFILHCKAKGLSPRTVETYQAHLEAFRDFAGNVPLESITEEDLQAYILARQPDVSPATINNHLRSLSVFLNYHKHSVPINKVKEKRKVIEPFSDMQIKLLLKQPDKKTFPGLRDFTLIYLLLDTGIRIQEALNICKEDIKEGFIKVTGKGNKERVVPIGQACRNALNEYLLAVEDISPDKPIFVSTYDNQLTRDRARRRLRLYSDKAGITGIRVSPHTFRHTFAKFYLLNGGDMFTLQKMLGHESLEMVRRYVEMLSGDVKEQHRKYSPLDSLVKKKRKL